jgi:hypothetical protein
VETRSSRRRNDLGCYPRSTTREDSDAPSSWHCRIERRGAGPDGTSNPIVWNADNKLYAWNGDTGAVIVDGTNTAMSTAVQKWNTPINANGRIAVGVNG